MELDQEMLETISTVPRTNYVFLWERPRDGAMVFTLSDSPTSSPPPNASEGFTRLVKRYKPMRKKKAFEAAVRNAVERALEANVRIENKEN